MKIRNFNKGIIYSSLGSFWWGFFGTYYFQYKTDDKESLKRISINAENNRTSEITIPLDGSPSYFFLRKCEEKITKEPIQIEMPSEPGKKIS